MRNEDGGLGVGGWGLVILAGPPAPYPLILDTPQPSFLVTSHSSFLIPHPSTERRTKRSLPTRITSPSRGVIRAWGLVMRSPLRLTPPWSMSRRAWFLLGSTPVRI